MRYIVLNLLCFGVLVCSSTLRSNDKPEQEDTEEYQDFEYEPEYDKIIRDYQRDVEVHNSWDAWGEMPKVTEK